MKLKSLFITLSALFFITSCIKDEGLEREADILSMTMDEEGFVTSIITDDIGNRTVEFVMAGNAEKYKNGIIAPKITVSKGATIQPASEEEIKLNEYTYSYIVTAEDGGQKHYTLIVKNYELPKQDFEKWREVPVPLKKPYMQLEDNMWDSGNKGIAIILKSSQQYPTRRSEAGEIRPGSTGAYSVLLETTRGNTNNESDLMDIPVFSGNMFYGKFITTLSDPLSSPHFGQPHPQYLGKPLKLTAYYNYKVGSPYVSWEYDKNKKKKISEDPERQDTFDLYAVLYKVSKSEEGENYYLTGHNINKFDQNAVVAYTPYKVAFDKDKDQDKWIKYEADFKYKEALDYKKYNYKLAIVLASSSEGANYMGAVGSRLLVDDLEIVLDQKYTSDAKN